MPNHHPPKGEKMIARLLSVLATTLAVGALLVAAGSPRTLAADAAQEHFSSPDEAARALVAAAKEGDTKALLAVLGPDAKRMVDSGDPVADHEARERFVKSYEEKNSIVTLSDTEAMLQTGKDDWPMPIPIVKDDAGWRFDSGAGEHEVLDRRIGRNELATIQACLAYVDAQREYYARDPEKSDLLYYAQRFASTKGHRDGLYFETREDEPESPLGSLFAQARAEGYGKGSNTKGYPFHGYYFRILKAQGPHAKGGAYDYLAHGKMMGGFALVAFPATWGSSGVMTFLVNHDGVVLEKNLGPKTAAIAQAMTKFDPDDTWKPVPNQDEEPESPSAE
ncbi:MAG TPA: DUF2950 domain-containing protein [Myxococcota bacterium]|nr:DUF2950 domain-containing protein [Myxococcota bacterium]